MMVSSEATVPGRARGEKWLYLPQTANKQKTHKALGIRSRAEWGHTRPRLDWTNNLRWACPELKVQGTFLKIAEK